MEDTNSNQAMKLRQNPNHNHRVQSLWQIWLPLGMVLLLASGMFCATIIVTRSDTKFLGQFQNAAIILLILPLAIIGIFTFIAFGLTIFGTSRLFPLVPKFRILSQHLDSISFNITTWSNRLMFPFVFVRGLRNRLTSKKKMQLMD